MNREAWHAYLAGRLADELWMLGNLLWIKPKHGPVEKFRLRPEQVALYRARWFRNVVLKARQLGFSTLIDLLIFVRCVTRNDYTAAIVDKRMEDAKKKLGIIARAWRLLDDPSDPHCRSVGAAIKQRVRLVVNSKTELAWSNGSSVYADTSIRGGTLQMLHISELAATAAKFPGRAEEIMAGGIPALDARCLIFSESTHEGGPFGVHHSLVKLAMGSCGKSLSPLDWRFHWFPWHVCADYRIGTGEIAAELSEYWTRLADQGIKLDDAQKRFYSAQYRVLKHRVKTEFPSTPDEALAAVSQGSIYGDIIAGLRIKGRIKAIDADPSAPWFTFWDIGQSDYTAIWLVQFSGREILWLDWHEDNGRPAGHYAHVVRKWENAHGITIAQHFLPHDANTRDKAGGKTWVDYLKAAGIHRVTVVPVTSDIWTGINTLRELLQRSYFHSRCEAAREKDGIEYPSGVSCLELYRKEVDVDSGRIKEMPVHDFTSHTASAARTLAEAWDRGMIGQFLHTGETRAAKQKGIKVLTGFMGAKHDDADFWREFDP